VPWTTDTFYIYRKDPPPATIYNFIGKTSKTVYTDTGLHNGSTYCYYVKSISEYPKESSKIKPPLYDSSETICGIPQDTIPPCPPPLYVAAKCLLYEDSLVWRDPDRLCPKANKTVKYEIYYTPVENGDMYVIATINNPKDTIYVIDSLGSVAGCYAVIAIDSLGQTSTFNTQCVDNCVNYQLPNVFTPNGDGINDLFTPLDGYRYVKDIDINIYNRWGQIVFHTNNPGINWNGNVDNSGGACPAGVYYYVCVVDEIRVTGIQPVTFKGFIELIRK
jgi:gliding motility-associated-like protein